MTTTLVLNLIGSIVIVAALVGVCRLGFLGASGRFDECDWAEDRSPGHEKLERLAA
jgi:hypothetical protein